MSEQPGIGRVLHYHLDNGEVRPAIVARVSPSGCDLQVFPSKADGLPCPWGLLDVQEGTGPGQWSWPEREEARLAPGQHVEACHYETVPHCHCTEPEECDCTCRDCLHDTDPELLRLLEERGYIVDSMGVLWRREVWETRGATLG